MADENRPREGYLVMADIVGYTAFFAGTELEHANGIIEELKALIQDRLVPPLRFVKLEGDAVFCYADAFTFDDGERLMELLEVCYCDFADRLFDMARSSTCGCAACASIDTLDLKFVAHYGTYLVQEFAGAQDLAGPDVILLHRLLKNSIAEQKGCRAYVFFTDACLQRLPAALSLPKHTETYEALGETSGGVHDLKPVLEEMREERREYIGPADADFERIGETPVPPPVLWQYFVDADKFLKLWTGVTGMETRPNALGRLGIGATSHCAHGDGGGTLLRYVDWRPFRYFTCEVESTKRSLWRTPPWTETFEFLPREDGGTVCHYRIRMQNRGRLFQLGVRLYARLLRRQSRAFQANLRRLGEKEELLAQYAAQSSPGAGHSQP